MDTADTAGTASAVGAVGAVLRVGAASAVGAVGAVGKSHAFCDDLRVVCRKGGGFLRHRRTVGPVD